MTETCLGTHLLLNRLQSDICGTSVLSPLSSSWCIFFVRYIAVVSICLVSDSSNVSTCPSILAVRFAFRLCFIPFVLLFVVLSGESRQNQGRGLVDRKLVQAP